MFDPLYRVTPGTTPAPLVTVGRTVACNKIRLQARSTNTGSIFIGTAANFTVDTAIAEIQPGATEYIGDEVGGNIYDIRNFFVLGENGTDSVIGGAITR